MFFFLNFCTQKKSHLSLCNLTHTCPTAAEALDHKVSLFHEIMVESFCSVGFSLDFMSSQACRDKRNLETKETEIKLNAY